MYVSVPSPSFSYEQAEAFFLVLFDAVRPLSEAVCTQVNISKSYHNNTGGIAGAASDVTRTGVFVVSLADNNYALILVPSLRLDVCRVGSTGNPDFLVDTELARVADFGTYIRGLTDEYNVPVMDIITAGIAT